MNPPYPAPSHDRFEHASSGLTILALSLAALALFALIPFLPGAGVGEWRLDQLSDAASAEGLSAMTWREAGRAFGVLHQGLAALIGIVWIISWPFGLVRCAGAFQELGPVVGKPHLAHGAAYILLLQIGGVVAAVALSGSVPEQARPAVVAAIGVLGPALLLALFAASTRALPAHIRLRLGLGAVSATGLALHISGLPTLPWGAFAACAVGLFAAGTSGLFALAREIRARR